MKILIQYTGFIVSPISRTYNFHVIDAPGESRQFTVQVPSESFRLTPLKFQDGPAICFERLQHEIDVETQELHAEAALNISGSDIQDYLDRHHPRKLRKKDPAAKLLPTRPFAEAAPFRSGLPQTVLGQRHQESWAAISGAEKLGR